jgi:hypothetical protein
MKTPLLVIAGNYQQFRDFCRNHNLSKEQARYISRPEDTVGKRGLPYIIIGDAYKKDNYVLLLKLMKARGHVEVQTC